MISVRTHFAWDERKPGFLEIDTVSHAGGNASGDHCYTLSITDVGTIWTEPFALRNNAHKWIKDAVTAAFPFPIKGMDSDNDGGFIMTLGVGECIYIRLLTSISKKEILQVNEIQWVKHTKGK